MMHSTIDDEPRFREQIDAWFADGSVPRLAKYDSEPDAKKRRRQAKAAKELFLCAGDTHLMPITRFEGQPVGDGRVGPVSKAIGELLELDAKQGDQDHQSISEF